MLKPVVTDTMTYICLGLCVRTCDPMRIYVQADVTVCVDRCVHTCTLKIYSSCWTFQKRLWVFRKRPGSFLKTSPSFLKSSASFSWRGRWEYPLIKPVIPSSPFILSFWFIHTGYQLVKDDSTSPHPPFSRAFQVPSQPAFSNCMSTHLFSPPVSVGADPCVCLRTVCLKPSGLCQNVDNAVV